MNVLHVNEQGWLAGGVEAYIAELGATLVDGGWESHLVYSAPSQAPLLLPSARRISFPDWPETSDHLFDQLGQALSNFAPVIAMVHALYHPELVQWLARRVPTLAYVHGPYVVCPGSAKYLRTGQRVCRVSPGAKCLVYAQLEKCCWGRNPVKHLRLLQRTRRFVQVYSSLNTVLVGSQYMAGLLRDANVASGTIAVLQPFLADDQLRPSEPVNDPPRILFAGRLVEEKGLGHLLQALSQLTIEYELIVAGSGPGRAGYQELAAKLGISSKVKFADHLDRREMREAYRSCSLVVIPSLWPEPFGRVGPEAAVHARPSIAYDVGGVAEWIEDGVSGFLVDRGDVAALADRIARLLADPALCARMGGNARDKALATWNPAGHVRELSRHFDRLLSS